MTQTIIQRSFAPFKRILPNWASSPIRCCATAIIGPIRACHRTGYFRSAFKMAAVSRNGQPLPWYTYPCIDFLKYRNFQERIVLEFGGGQSTLWWAKKARHVVTVEGNKGWYEKISGQMPDNVDLCYASMESKEMNVSDVTRILGAKQHAKYDVIVIDGLHREEMIPISLSRLAKDGVIVCDNAESFNFYEGFKESGLWRVDFFGNAPGVVLPHATSIYFNPSSCFVFDAAYPIPVIATEPEDCCHDAPPDDSVA